MQPPSCATSPPRGTGLKCDDAGKRKYYTIATGGCHSGGAKAGIAGALEERYGNLI
jgi:hypothetical protein